MFESIHENLSKIFSRLAGYGKLSPEIVDETLREIRRALLSADVNFKVTQNFVKRVREKAIGKEVMESLTPAQEVIRIVRDEIVKILGDQASEPDYQNIDKPLKIILMGLQGSGKTTTALKLAVYLRDKKMFSKPAVIACDLERPAAVLQLEQMAKETSVKVLREGKTPLEVARNAINNRDLYDVYIFDSQGRLHIDELMMKQLKELSDYVDPHLKFLVIDSMTGQESVNVASTFDEEVGFDGSIITKLDGDARGGAALSIKEVTGKPIVYAGTGERVADIEVFYPDRIAGRIMGMGDVLTLIEKAEKEINQKKTGELQEKLLSGEFTLEDFLEQMKELKRIGSIKEILSFFPAQATRGLIEHVDDRMFARSEAIILSMTVEERRNPVIINASRKERIARGSGTSVQEVNKILKSYFEAKKMFKSLKKLPKKRFGVKFPFIG